MFLGPERFCRICGCTDDDCSQCIEAQGEPCFWIEENLCSRCAKKIGWLKKPRPKKHDECDFCLKIRPLLVPVAFIPGYRLTIIWLHLCFECRLNVQHSRHLDFYGEPAAIWKYSANPKMRKAYKNYIEGEISI